MPLYDHFHPPLSERRHWHAFHNAWATYIASELNRLLPSGYFAEPNVQFGIEIDVATFEEADQNNYGASDTPSMITATPWTPPAPVQTIPFVLTSDTVEVLVYGSEGGPWLSGAIELVSPANKDRPEHCRAFVAKYETYLQQAVGLVLIDVVTSRKENLHDLLLRHWGTTPTGHADIYASAYRPIQREERPSLDIWYEGLVVGQPLPRLPLWLRGGLCFSVDLQGSYERTCIEQRVAVSA